jgi:D-alanine-D-alanine ligase
MRIALLTGGSSAEREVALATAAQVVPALRSRGHRVTVVDTTGGPVPEADEPRLLGGAGGRTPPPGDHLDGRERRFLLSGLADLAEVRTADVVFLALHGGRGEDGTLQSVLDILEVPYTGSGALASALAMDKDVSKQLFRAAGIPTADWLMAPATAAQVTETLGWPVIVKPSRQGSTVGLTLVREPGELEPAMALAARYDDEVMLETFVPGRELTVGILDGAALAVGEIIPRHEIFDYECKYTPGMATEVFPAALPAAWAGRCQDLALRAHRALKLGGYSRVDFRLTAHGEMVCLEANTLPGMTATSLLPQSAGAAGIGFPELCERICRAARGRIRGS